VQRLGFGQEVKKNSAVSRTHARTHAPAITFFFSAQACIYTWPVVCGHVAHWVPREVKLLVTYGWEDAHEDAPAGVYTRNVVYTEVL